MSWFTKETFVFGSKLDKVSEEPGTHLVDEAGNNVVGDGNHRAYRDIVQNGSQPNSRQVGTMSGDVSSDPDYRKVSDLRVSNAKPPFED